MIDEKSKLHRAHLDNIKISDKQDEIEDLCLMERQSSSSVSSSIGLSLHDMGLLKSLVKDLVQKARELNVEDNKLSDKEKENTEQIDILLSIIEKNR
jgi:hypothetical protein